jgi:endogenous inhibitor of DNA gyrase (YacG/DUF329 family)
MEIKCDTCGRLFIYKDGISHYKRTKRHFCSVNCQNIKHGLARRKKQDKRYKIWCDVKKRAKNNNTEFTLTINDIPEIPEFCPVLGVKIIANKNAGPIDSSPSLDRINPKLGYIVGNVRIICNRANRIKSDATLEEIKLILKDAENIQNKNK